MKTETWIVYRLPVNRTRTPQSVLDATGRKQYTDKSVVSGMPHGTGDEAEVVFFNIGRFVTDDELEKEYELRGLVPADPYSQAAVNEADESFADEKPNATHWKNSDGKWCFADFRCWFGMRKVDVVRDNGRWDGDWWFAGLRKISIQTSGS